MLIVRGNGQAQKHWSFFNWEDGSLLLKVIDEAKNSALKCWEHCFAKALPIFLTGKMAAYFESN